VARKAAEYGIKKTGQGILVKRALTLFLLALLLASCAGPMTGARRRYNVELKRWTREAKLFNGLEERLSVVATYRGPSFKSAYRDYYARSFGLSDKDRARMLATDKRAAKEYSEFFLSVHTSEAALNNLDAEDSAWRIFLSDDRGTKTEPLSITRLVRADPLRGEFFPYLDLWSAAYVVRFPRLSVPGNVPLPALGATTLNLTIKSVLGSVEMTWPLGTSAD